MPVSMKTYICSLFSFLLLLLSFMPAHAAAQPVMGDILKKTEVYYQQTPAFTADFRQWTTSAAAGSVTTEASGKLFYKKPKKMRWEYEKPEKQAFIANQQVAWLSVPAENQISLFDAKMFFSSPLARTFFDGVSELKNYFDVTIDSRQSTAASAVLKLVPKGDDPNFKSLYLWIDLQSYQIHKIESLDVLGNANVIVLESQRKVPDLDSSLFRMTLSTSTSVTDTDGQQLPAVEIEKLKNRISNQE